jgi:hypothetical protein
MAQPFSKMTQPLFFTVIDSANPAVTSFINAAHVVRIDIDAVNRKSGTLHLINGAQVQLGANEADTIMRLMAVGAHEQHVILSEF